MPRPRSKYLTRTYRIKPEHELFINAKAQELEIELSEVVRRALDLFIKRNPLTITPVTTENRFSQQYEGQAQS